MKDLQQLPSRAMALPPTVDAWIGLYDAHAQRRRPEARRVIGVVFDALESGERVLRHREIALRAEVGVGTSHRVVNQLVELGVLTVEVGRLHAVGMGHSWRDPSRYTPHWPPGRRGRSRSRGV